MADKAAAEGSAPNMHKDEVTGEMVSKSELKKRQKKRDAEAKKVCFRGRGENTGVCCLLTRASTIGRESCRCPAKATGC